MMGMMMIKNDPNVNDNNNHGDDNNNKKVKTK